MAVLTAKITDVKMGPITMPGLMDTEGKYYVGIPQMVDLNLVPPNRSLKQLEAILGKGFQSHKAKTEINPKAINVIPVNVFEAVIVELSAKGNESALELNRALVGLSLHQLFCDAFGVKFEAEDRQQWLETRLQGKVARRTLTDAIQDYCMRNEVSDNYKHFVYRNVSDCLNRAMFGKSAKELCEERGCVSGKLRDTHDGNDLKQIEYVETNAMKLVDRRNLEPLEAVKQAVALYV